MKLPISTGQAARLLNTTEPRLAETVRRGKVQPAPPILAGRRLWDLVHLLQAAENFGVLPDELHRRLGEEFTRSQNEVPVVKGRVGHD
ncbi:MAG: hypothetical protein ACKVXR_03885 [Planctomycetota bacterium]